MLIIYRTNPGFEGQIATLDYQTSPESFELWLNGEKTHGRAELAFLQLNEALMTPALLAALEADQNAYRVIGGKLAKDGVPVPLGYDPALRPASPRKMLKEMS